MSKLFTSVLIVGTLALSACGRPDATGVYVARTNNDVAMFQIVQTKDGAISGRVEDISIGPDGAINDQTDNLDGAASNHELIFKPASVWSGGVSASGTFSGDTLTISHGGTEVTAKKSTLAIFDQDATQIRTQAAQIQRQIAMAKAKQEAEAAQAAAAKEAAIDTEKLGQAVTVFHAATSKLNQEVSSAPNFVQRSQDNTAKVAKMVQMAPSLSGPDRGQLAVRANQVAIATNQIEIARTQYAIELGNQVQQIENAISGVRRFCASPQGAQFAQRCSDAISAANDFDAAVKSGSATFHGFKVAIQAELDRQNQMVQRIGG